MFKCISFEWSHTLGFDADLQILKLKALVIEGLFIHMQEQNNRTSHDP